MQTLRISANNISDEAILTLTNAMLVDSSLKELDFRNVRGLSATGWEAFFTAITTLEVLDLRGRDSYTSEWCVWLSG